MTSLVGGIARAAGAVRAARHGIVYAAPRRKRRREVALTFDDGPSPEWTPAILDVLASFGARATFFVLGAAVVGREHVLRRAVAEGHELGNHAYSHADPAGLSDEALRVELERTNSLLAPLALRPTLHFRPPYANTDFRVADVARSLGLRTVLRSVDPADWNESDAGVITARVLDAVRPGSIVCLHDGVAPDAARGEPTREPTVAAVRSIAGVLAARGFELVTVRELLA